MRVCRGVRALSLSVGVLHHEDEAIASTHPDLLSDIRTFVTAGAPDLTLDANLADRLTWRDYPGPCPDQCLRTNGHRSTSQDPNPEEGFSRLGEHGESDDGVSPRVGDDKDGQQNGDGDEHEVIVAAAAPSANRLGKTRNTRAGRRIGP